MNYLESNFLRNQTNSTEEYLATDKHCFTLYIWNTKLSNSYFKVVRNSYLKVILT